MSETFLSDVIKGAQAGALDAIRDARLFNTMLSVWRNGKVVEITPDEAEAMIKDKENKKADK